jgi:hypothetical protein
VALITPFNGSDEVDYWKIASWSNGMWQRVKKTFRS